MPVVCVWLALVGAILPPSPALALSDADQIRFLIGATWDKPDAKVTVDPVIVSGTHAVASWTQGERGGRALRRRGGTGWSVILCSGDPLRAASSLVAAGVPQDEAGRIADGLARAEALVPPRRRALFSRFEGTVTLDDADRKPLSHPHETTP